MSSALLVIRQSVLSEQGPTAAGLLQSAYALSLAIGMVLNPTNGLYLTPIMNRNLEPAEKIGTARAYQSRLMALLVLLGAPLVLAPKTCIYILFSSRFLDAADWVYLFVLAQMVFQLAGIYQAMLIGLDRLNAFAVSTFGGHATAGVVAWLIVPTWGVEGAALALLAGASFSCAVSLFWLHRQYGFLRALEPFGFVAYGLIAIPVAGYVALGFPEWEPVAFAVRILVGVLLLAGTTLFMTGKDRRALRDAVLKRVRRRA
jgi:O-antigen/teichoic acid export membrane protein